MATSFFGGAFFGGEFFNSSPTPPPADTGVKPSGGFPAYEYERRDRKTEIRKRREELGILRREEEIIAEIAARQAQALELDAQKRFEELSRQLELQDIRFETRHLERLNQLREELITAEIAARIRLKLKEEENMVLLMLLLAANA